MACQKELSVGIVVSLSCSIIFIVFAAWKENYHEIISISNNPAFLHLFIRNQTVIQARKYAKKMHHNSNKLASEFKKSKQKKNCGFSMHSANWNQFQDFLRRENKQKMPALKRNGEKVSF